MICRIKELEQIQKFIKRKRSFLILGIRGIGKTTLLKYMQKEYKACYIEYGGSTKQILETLTRHFKIHTERSIKYFTIQDILELIVPYIKRRKTILLIDEMDSLSKHGAKLLAKLEDDGVVIIGASERKIWSFRFRERLELSYLSRRESKRTS